MKCPYCNLEHSDTIKFCPNTGQKLFIEQVKCDVCGNTDLTKEHVYCTNCGNRLVSKDGPSSSTLNTDSDKSKTRPLYIGGNLFFHILAIFLWSIMIISGVVNLILCEYRIALVSLFMGCLCGGIYYYAKK